MKKLLKNRYIQLIIASILGYIGGSLFAPEVKLTQYKYEELKKQHDIYVETSTKLLKESRKKYEKKIEKYESEKVKQQTQITTLETQVKVLTKKSSKLKVKIVRPDGTIVEKESEKSFEQSREEYVKYAEKLMKLERENLKLTIEKEFYDEKVKITQSYEKRLRDQRSSYRQELNKFKKIVNEKRFRIYGGAKSALDNIIKDRPFYYGGVQYDIAKPFLLDINLDQNANIGVGLGISF